FATGLPAYVLIKVFAPGFFARKDTKTPVKVAVVGLLSNLAIMAMLIWSLGHVGIALATAGAAWINGGILCYILIKRGHFKPDARLRHRLVRILLASALMAVALWAASWAMARYVPDTKLFEALALGGMVVLGLAVYAIAGQVLGAFNLADIRAMVRRRAPKKGT
ncbi:MAG: lipid II flippase MurJ, partial [Rhodospirillaceae bacterium]|nr:lipid II flippase MurJ [Rhodospirillaceae bacterium]